MHQTYPLFFHKPSLKFYICLALQKEDKNGPLQMQIIALDYSSFVGAIGIGKINRGIIKKNMQAVLIDSDGKNPTQLYQHYNIDVKLIVDGGYEI